MSFRIRLVAFLFALCNLGHLQAQTNAAPAPVAQPDSDLNFQDVIYGKGGDQDLHAMIASPKNVTKPLPAFIWIHGGGWSAGSYTGTVEIKRVAREGYIAVSIEYRFSQVAKWPAQIEDCQLAVRWLRANAAKYNVDPDRIGVGGGSAGGHLAACVGTMANMKEYEGDQYPGVSSSAKVVVDFFGPTDFTTPGLFSPAGIEISERLFGTTFAQNPDLWKSGSPVFYVKAGDPSMILIHGDSDSLVPLSQSTVMDAALAKAGVPHDFLIVKNAEHSLKPLAGKVIDPNWHVINATADAFIAKYLKNPAPLTSIL